MTGTSKNVVIVVRRGMVDSVYCSKDISLFGAKIIDLDSTDLREIRNKFINRRKHKVRIKQFNKDSMSNNRCGACFRLRISFMNKATESRRYNYE